MTPVCPNCGNSTHIAGIEVRGTYDGVLIWECQRCGHRWPRFSDSPNLGGRLHRQALELLKNWSDEEETGTA